MGDTKAPALLQYVFVLFSLVACARAQHTSGSTTPGTKSGTNIPVNLSSSPQSDQTNSTRSSIAAIILGALATGETSTLLTGFMQRMWGNGDKDENHLFMAAFKEVLVRNKVGELCQEDMIRTVEGLQSYKPWAWKMLDAAGKLHSGILDDFNRWKFLGDYDQCSSVEATGNDDNNNHVTYFRGRKCAVIVKLPPLPIVGKDVVVSEAVCVSDRCNNIDLTNIINAVQQMLFNGTVRHSNFFTHCTVEVSELTTEAKIVIAVLCILCSLLVIGTVYDTIVIQMKWIGTSDCTVEKPANPIGIVGRILLAFSVYTNGRRLLSTHQSSDNLGSIHGIRFLSMAWIILAHTYFNSRYYSKNLIKHVFYEKFQQWTFMFVPYAGIVVDSFFLISGTLVAYLTLRELKRVGWAFKMNWLMFYFHRFWRLTPAYMLVLMTGTVLLPYISNGPQWSNNSQTIMGNCRENWWTNLLYINNYVTAGAEGEMCMGWTWYLANDMQFYIISPLIVLPLFYNFAAGVCTCMVFMAATLIMTIVLTSLHEYNAQTAVDHISPPKDDQSFATIYSPSYVRMGPYIIGVFVGYLLYRWNCKLPERPRLSAVVKKLTNISLWLLAIGICCVIVYAPFNKDNTNLFSKGESVAYITLSRTAWAVAVGWMIFSCACGFGGWINQLLSWKAFIPLGRLTYCAYLIHPIVQLTFISSTRQPFYFTDYSAVYLYFGHMVTSYGLAFVVSLAFEAPLVGLERAILMRDMSADDDCKRAADDDITQRKGI